MRVDFASLSQEKLVILVQNTGDGDAFSFLVRPLESPLIAFLTRLTSSYVQAEDICQEAMLKAYINIGKFQARSSFKTWLFSIAYKEFLQSQRKASSFSRLVAALEGFARDFHEPDVGGSMDMQKALSRLSHTERAAILLSDGYGLTHAEIAETMNAPLGTVKTYIKRAKLNLNLNRLK